MLKPSNRVGTWLGVLALGGLFAWVAISGRGKNTAEPLRQMPQQFAQTEKPRPSREEIFSRLMLVKEKYTSSSGRYLMVSFDIKNDNDFSIKDFIVRYRFYGNSGTEIRSEVKAFYELVPPKSFRSVKDAAIGFMPDQAKRVSSEIISYGAP